MKLPKEIFAQHIAVLGKTGSGKSSVLRLQVERLLDEKQPVCIIDPKGDWFGLKLAASGKSAGYPVIIFGGEHGDVPINAHSGAHIAELIATGNRPCIIDLGGWMVGERTRFFVDFASTLFRTTRGHRYLVIDEVHNFAPQGKVLDPDAGKMLHWANRLASEGRGKGLTILSASQRPQKVHKDFLTCAETLIAMRVIHKLDRDAIKDWVDGAGDPAKGKEVLDTLASMARGQAWVWSPEIGFGPKQITFPMFKTYDSFAPKANSGTAKLKGWASVDLEEVSAKLAKVVEESKANDPAELKKQIAELKRQIGTKPAPVADVKAVERAVSAAVSERDRHWKGELSKFEKAHGSVVGRLTKIHQLSTLNGDASVAVSVPEKSLPITPTILARASEKPWVVPKVTKTGDESTLPIGEAKILAALIQYPDGLDRSQLTVLTGYKRSSRDAYIARLQQKGYVATNGGRVQATPEGQAALPNAEPLPTGAQLQQFWRQRLPIGEQAILGLLIEAHPNSVPRDELSDRTGYKRSSRDAYIARMIAKQLVVPDSNGVRASDNLF